MSAPFAFRVALVPNYVKNAQGKPMMKGRSMAKKTVEQIERLKQRKAQLEARLQMLEARQRTQDRKRDTRRKVLAGAMILHQVETRRFPRDEFIRMMDEFLTRDYDRELFGLPVSGNPRAQ
jgi:predicted membrane chloride channel (bestrophin family)